MPGPYETPGRPELAPGTTYADIEDRFGGDDAEDEPTVECYDCPGPADECWCDEMAGDYGGRH